MKKISLILFFLGCFAIKTQAQEPTKQETMDWIASKMVTYGKHSYSNIYSKNTTQLGSFTSVNKTSTGKVVYSTNNYSVYLHNTGNTVSMYLTLTIDLSNVYSVEVIEKEGMRNMSILGSNIYNRKLHSGEEQIEKNDNKAEVYSRLMLNAPHYKDDDPENYFTQSLIDFSAEADLFNRMYKAFQTLAKYNNAEKPKEKF